MREPGAENDYLADHAALLLASYERLLGRSLVTAGDPIERAKSLYEAPFVVCSHDTASDPIFNYANLAAQKLFELDWSTFVTLPSRLSAGPMHRDERQRLPRSPNMMSLSQINQMAEDAAKRAKAKGLRPIQIGSWAAESEERVAQMIRHMPFIGDWRPRDLELVPREDLAESQDVGPDRLSSMWYKAPYLFVDASGFGGENEPALTRWEFVQLVRANPQDSYAIVEAGQFQVVVGVFRNRGREH